MKTVYELDKNGYRYAAQHIGSEGIAARSVPYEGGCFTQKLSRYPELVICGGGHVALALCGIAKTIGFTVTVIDDRPEFANTGRFSQADTVICSDFETALAGLENPAAWYAVMTRGHSFDGQCVARILARPFMYLGMIGSRTKIAHTRSSLIEKGYTEDQLTALHAPIGLAIGAQTPGEIAVSIAAELIQERSRLGCSYLDESVYDLLRTYTGGMTVVTIVGKEGSAPRGVGSCMAVRDDGTPVGTIGGGAVEAAAIVDARSVTDGSKPFVKTYGLSNGDASGLGMVCGGTIVVLFERVPPL